MSEIDAPTAIDVYNEIRLNKFYDQIYKLKAGDYCNFENHLIVKTSDDMYITREFVFYFWELLKELKL